MVSSIITKNESWDNFQYIKLSQHLFFGRIDLVYCKFPKNLVPSENLLKLYFLDCIRIHCVAYVYAAVVLGWNQGNHQNFNPSLLLKNFDLKHNSELFNFAKLNFDEGEKILYILIYWYEIRSYKSML